MRPQAVVISLKSRSCPVDQAVEQSLQALAWLQRQGCRQFYFKYCSTFDSTAQGNIGPVTDALLDALGEQQTVISPALPVNGRTVYQGYLFVLTQLQLARDYWGDDFEVFLTGGDADLVACAVPEGRLNY